MSEPSERIGFIGVGLMGHGMAKNIVEKGYPLTVMGPQPRPVEDLVERGASEAASVARGRRAPPTIVFICVTGSPRGGGDRPRARRAEGGPEEGLGRRRLLDLRSDLHRRARRRTRRDRASTLVDAPLSRTPKEAWEGTLDTMVGATRRGLRAASSRCSTPGPAVSSISAAPATATA